MRVTNGCGSADSAAAAVTVISGSTPDFTSTGIVTGTTPGLVPGSLATIYGTNLTTNLDLGQIVGAANVPLPRSLAGTSVLVGGTAAPVLAVARLEGHEQINFQVPWELGGSSGTTVTVVNNGAVSPPVSVSVSVAQPWLYLADERQLLVFDAVSYARITESAPAVPGEYLMFYATGLGPVNPTPATGSGGPARQPLSMLQAGLSVQVGGQDATVEFAGLAPGLVGVYQLNIRVPDAAPAGVASVVVGVPGTNYRASGLVPIANGPGR